MLITSLSKVIIAKKKSDVSGLKKLMQEKFGTSSKEELTDDQAQQLLVELESIVK